ncbi:MAG: hypothetical protein WC058_15045 [Phycisphaeraceae bacterium]
MNQLETRNPKLETALPVAAAIVLFIGGLFAVSGYRQFVILGLSLILDGLTVIGYFAAAAGYGAWIGRAMLGRSHGQPVAAMALGCGAMLMGAWVLAWMGMLNGVTAWGLMIVGWAGLILAMKALKQARTGVRLSWVVVLVMPVVGLMIGAATIAPGILWQPSEAGGYDVLSYHLQLPAQWLRGGAMRGLHHNVYSYLPNLVEAGFMQLAAIRGGAVEAALCCQLMSAGFALLAAGAIGAAVMRLLNEYEPHRRMCAATAGAMSLALPWTVVTGSMAYDEQAVQFFAAAAMGLMLDPDEGLRKPSSGLGAGLLAGFACLAKLTSAGMAAMPLLIALVIWKRRNVLWFIIGAALPVALYMLRNAIWTGNPLFPQGTSLFGTAHWTTEQAARWRAAHQPNFSMVERLARVWEMIYAHGQYAYILWPAAGMALVGMIADNVLRRTGIALAAMIGAGGLFWIFATHEQSRFALPLVVPACVAIGAGLSLARARWARVVLIVALIGWPGAMSFRLWRQQSDTAPLLIDGTELMRRQRMPYAMLNDQPAGRRTYAEGWAVPLYDTSGTGGGEAVSYHTVWDRGELGALIDRHGVRGALDALAQQGYRRLLIDRGMIARWMSEGNYGYDPSITPGRLNDIEQAGMERIYDDGRIVIYRLPTTGSGGEDAPAR